ncbi:hypothetical protein M8C21_025259, partial [Ambrosia artemisiifolia]
KQNEDEVGFSFTNTLKSIKGSFTEKINGENVDFHVFDLSTLTTATDNFSHLNKLGVGGFGTVYKGKLLNGQEIAVKRLSQSSVQGMQEFRNEVWDLWKQEKPLLAVDSSLGDTFNAQEVLLCIHVGILCVQELAVDRPTMTDVASMLSNHETVLPSPNQPAFIFKQLNHGRDHDVGSVNDEDITILHAR